MYRNHFLIAIRNLNKNRVTTLIKTLGLTIGIVSFLFILEFLSFETSFDDFNDHADRIYRVINKRYQNGELIQNGSMTYPTIGPTMAKDFEEIDKATRIISPFKTLIKVNDEFFEDISASYVDHNFYSIFNYNLLVGSKESIFQNPYEIVLTESSARKYFHNAELENVLGEELLIGSDESLFKVVGICSDPPKNSHLQFDLLISYTTAFAGEDKSSDNSWSEWSYARHYVLLKEGADPNSLTKKFEQFSRQYFKGSKVSGSIESFTLQPLTAIHLYGDYDREYAITSNASMVWAMLIVALSILTLAVINFINLTTAKTLDRSKEVGVRKVLGAQQHQLIIQFFIEAILISFIAIVFALVLVLLLQSSFNKLVQTELTLLNILISSDFIVPILMLSFVAMLVFSGGYPAYILSTSQPGSILKGKFGNTARGLMFRKTLVVFQFVITFILIISSFIVVRQMDFVSNTDLGIDINNTLIINPPSRSSFDALFSDRVTTFKNSIKKLPHIKSVATSDQIPGNPLWQLSNIRLSADPLAANYSFDYMIVGEDFFRSYDIQVIEGRQFNYRDYSYDIPKERNVLINQKLAKLIGEDNDLIGFTFFDNDEKTQYRIVGVVEDFHQRSLHKSIEPLIFLSDYYTANPFSIKINGKSTPTIIANIRKCYQEAFNDNPFHYYFLKDAFNQQYSDDKVYANVSVIFTFVALLLSCLGLIGLSTYSIEQRTKEIAVRKVYGASISSIISLLSTDYLKLVILAAVFSIPFIYYVSNLWIARFEYRISIGISEYGLPILLLIIVSFITIIFQILNTAKQNPAAVLKSE